MKLPFKPKILADSTSWVGTRITTMIIPFPTCLLAELNTHRQLSKSAVSARAVPIDVYIQKIQDCPYIPIFTGKQKGMQGKALSKEEIENKTTKWLGYKDKLVDMAIEMNNDNTHKQQANRILAPVAFTSVVITGTDWQNLFDLRCPKYQWKDNPNKQYQDIIYKSQREMILKSMTNLDYQIFADEDWFKDKNQSYAQPEFQYIAEMMYDLYNESEPEYLQEGEWHIPFNDVISDTDLYNQGIDNGLHLTHELDQVLVMVSASCCAKQSYDNAERNESLDKHIERHDKLIVDKHMGVFEHQARVPTPDELEHFREEYSWGKEISYKGDTKQYATLHKGKYVSNLKGWIQYRKIIENDERIIQV